MKFDREKSEWVFSSGRRCYAHTENLGVTFNDGEPSIAYGYDGGLWKAGDKDMKSEDLLELADLQIQRWQAFKDWLAQRTNEL